jgi:hypothetical protein
MYWLSLGCQYRVIFNFSSFILYEAHRYSGSINPGAELGCSQGRAKEAAPVTGAKGATLVTVLQE